MAETVEILIAKPNAINKENVFVKSTNPILISLVFTILIVLGCINFITYKVMFNAYGEDYSFFVSQGVNVLFVVYGGLIVYPMQLFTDRITPEMTLIPKRKFVIMGLLDCFGTFFTAMGAVYTPGQFQTLLNQSLIPLTMLASYVFLHARYHRLQLIGAVIILFGAAAVLIPACFVSASTLKEQFLWYACLVYWMSNIPMACSAVYKEYAFKNHVVNVIYLTQWVSVFQLLFGFVMAPLQLIPAFGSSNIMHFNDIFTTFSGGVKCCFQIDGECSDKYTFLLLVGYCFINFCFNTTGLYLMKIASANLNSMTFAVILPVSTIMFSLDFLGPYREHLAYYTFVGLVLVLFGVGLYRFYSDDLTALRRSYSSMEEAKVIFTKSVSDNDIDYIPCSFQERIVGIESHSIRVSLSSREESWSKENDGVNYGTICS